MAQAIVGIDVGTTKVCTLVGEVDAEGELQVIGVGVATSHGLKKGTIINITEATDAIRESIEAAERSSGYEIGRAYVSLAGEHVNAVNSSGVVAISRHSPIAQEDIDRAMEAAQAIPMQHNREIVHVVPRSYTLDGQEGVRTPLGMHGFRLEVEAHIVTGSSSSIENLGQCIRGLGVEVDQFVLNPLAAADAVLSATEREMGVVLADIGGGTTDIGIFIDGAVYHTVVLPVGGNHVTNDIAMGLRLPFAMAEEIKIEHGHCRPRDVDPLATFLVTPFGDGSQMAVSRADLATIIEYRVEEIFDLLLQEIKRSGYDGLLPAGLVLCGGSSQLPGIRELARDVLGLPVRVAVPENLSGLVDKISTPAFATSVGLLRWGMREGAMPLPRRDHRGLSLGAWLKNRLRWFRNLLPDGPES